MARPKFYPRKVKTSCSEYLGLKHGFRSGLEDVNAKYLLSKGQAVEYEGYTMSYTQPSKRRKYTCDFVLWNGILIETKGAFPTADRQKHLMIKQDYPDLDLRFVFSRPQQRISKQSKTSYAAWCDHKGFQWAGQIIPDHWVTEKPNMRAVEAAVHALGWEPPWERKKK